MLKSHQDTVEMLTSVNAKVLEDSSTAIKDSEKTISETTAKVKKLHEEVTSFMAEFRSSSDKNIEAMNKIEKLQKDLAVKNNIMDQLAEKTPKAKVLTLFDKLQPVFTMLNQIEGISGRNAFQKQGGDKEPQPKKMTEEQ
ncbi:unnamed protein product [Lactuca saligna]|uniref:Uncharacterized protein n=1 Tax=Lactuca saligna TaxID=75948 RepID=A0AA36E4R7_LACSI|nr:unnamed protein product [Lactuca saligna]